MSSNDTKQMKHVHVSHDDYCVLLSCQNQQLSFDKMCFNCCVQAATGMSPVEGSDPNSVSPRALTDDQLSAVLNACATADVNELEK